MNAAIVAPLATKMKKMIALRNLLTWSSGVLMALSLVACGSGQTSADAAKDVVIDFHHSLIENPMMGVPSAAGLKQISPFISARLEAQLAAAAAAEARAQLRHHGTEPPMVQGALFYSMFEGAQRVVDIQTEQDAAIYQVTFEYLPFADSETQRVQWHDRTFVVLEQGRYVVDDVEYQGEWQFKPVGKLSEVLQRVIDSER